MNLRKNDVKRRRKKVELYKEDLLVKKKHFEERELQFNEEFEKEKALAEEEEREFNDEEFKIKFLEKSPEIIVS